MAILGSTHNRYFFSSGDDVLHCTKTVYRKLCEAGIRGEAFDIDKLTIARIRDIPDLTRDQWIKELVECF